MDSAEPYTYEPLPEGKYIRVLDLLPAEEMDSPIQLHLRAVPLEKPMADENAFEALSYVWGDSSIVKPIYCDGKTLNVTTNCFTALQYLRLKDKTRTLWVDAICINQAGAPEEKSNQITLMCDIYVGASKVVIWLGDKRGRGWLLMRMRERSAKSSRFNPLRLVTNHLMDGVYLGAMGVRTAFSDSFSSPYFTRAWTFQEMVLATKAEFVFRHATVPWYDSLSTNLFDTEGTDTVVFCEEFRSALANPESLNDWHGLGDFYQSLTRAMARRRCFLPHDKLFAMYGILRAIGLTLPKPDYNEDFTILWEKFFRQLLISSRTLLFIFTFHVGPVFRLSFLSPDEDEPKDENPEALPTTTLTPSSWVPHFAQGRQWEMGAVTDRLNFGLGKFSDFPQTYRECHLLPPTAITTADQRGKLLVAGKRLGEVSIVEYLEVDHFWKLRRKLSSFHDAWRTVREASNPAFDDSQTLESLLGRYTYSSEAVQLVASGASGDISGDLELADMLINDVARWGNVILAGSSPGFGTEECEKGDIVVLLDGAPLETVIRPLGDGTFRLVGQALVAGVKNKDWECFKNGSLEDFEQFCLV